MRVIGGTARGRPLRAPRTAAVRPTSDRVREAIFDVLGSLGAVEGAAVCDLFAGSGALGIEALSRGAASVTFVESAPAAVAALQANLTSTGFAGRAEVRVVRRDARTFLATIPTAYDLVLADPPYAFTAWAELLAPVRAGVVVAEHRDPILLPDHLVEHRVYRYGSTIVTVARVRREVPARSTCAAADREGLAASALAIPEDGS
ncbi:MAG: RsmD family RNA methyltransferase [Actinomycetota bacterium]|nr:RsmD family RNA methyltransferase [Actinomycetota bacterium]